MAQHTILLLPGDGIGPEIIAQSKRVLAHIATQFALDLQISQGLIGGCSIDIHGTPLTDATVAAARAADAVLLGAVGGPKWDNLPMSARAEAGLLKIRKELDLFTNLRPAVVFSALLDASTLKADIIEGLDIMIVRELTSGIYFGEPKGISTTSGERFAFNTMRYSESEIARVVRVACKIAQQRQSRLCSVDKANVLDVSQLWREVTNDIVASEFPDIKLSHMYVDNAAMQLVRDPKQFDVIVTGNLFGDILSDCAAMLTGSIGMLPSASISCDTAAVYEPVHGSAPDLAGKNIANPCATFLSIAMMMQYSLARPDIALAITQAIATTLNQGYRTRDLHSDGITTKAMTDYVLMNLTSP